MKKYKDYIGAEIVCEHPPYTFKSQDDALRHKLLTEIHEAQGYKSAILTRFSHVIVTVCEKTNQIVVKGIVAKCEADC